jgi:hypothetical protein
VRSLRRWRHGGCRRGLAAQAYRGGAREVDGGWESSTSGRRVQGSGSAAAGGRPRALGVDGGGALGEAALGVDGAGALEEGVRWWSPAARSRPRAGGAYGLRVAICRAPPCRSVGEEDRRLLSCRWGMDLRLERHLLPFHCTRLKHRNGAVKSGCSVGERG